MKSETTSNAIPRTSRRPPEPPKLVPKSWKIVTGDVLNAPLSKFGRTSILDNPPMVLNGFSRAGPSLDHQNLIKNRSRNHSRNIHRKRKSMNRFPMKNDAPRPPKWDPKFMKNRAWTSQGPPLGSQGHSQVAQMSPRRPQSLKKHQKWRLRAPQEPSMTARSSH